MRRSPPASTRLPTLAERKRPRAELTPDAGVGACPFVPFVPQTPFTWSASPEDLRDAALLREAWGVVVPVRTPPRLDVLES